MKLTPAIKERFIVAFIVAFTDALALSSPNPTIIALEAVLGELPDFDEVRAKVQYLSSQAERDLAVDGGDHRYNMGRRDAYELVVAILDNAKRVKGAV